MNPHGEKARKKSSKRHLRQQRTQKRDSVSAPRAQPMVRLALYVCILLSGAAGLIYEVVWARQLTLFLGTTAQANAAVLTAFMTGLAAGSYFIGRCADREREPIRLYALLEIGIGLYGLSTPWLFGLIQSQYALIAPVVGLQGFGSHILRFSLALTAMLIPTFLMGGTLPLLVRGLTSNLAGLSRSTARLYGINTLGATIGAFAAGYLLLPTMGVRGTLLLTVLFNLLAGVVVLAIRKQLPSLDDRAAIASDAVVESENHLSPNAGRILLAGFAVSGFAALVYQVVWIRALVLVIGSSVYAFSTTLTTFLGGVALGSLAYVRLAKNHTADTRLRHAAYLQLGISLSAVISLYLIGQLPELFMRGYAVGLPNDFVAFQAFIFLLCSLVMLLPTLMMGALFPLITSLWTRDASKVGRGVGTAYAANALGTILGAFLGGLFMMTALGIQGSLHLAAGLSAAVGGLFWWLRPARTATLQRYGGAVLCMVLFGVLALLLPKWDREIMQSGVFVNADDWLANIKARSLREKISHRQTLYYGEGLDSVVSVFQTPKQRLLVINGKTDASSKGDLPTQIMVGQLPLLLHPHPQRALVVGLGSGISAGAVATHDSLSRMDILEISPQVVEASHYFKAENGDVLSDPRVRLAVADARNFVLAQPDLYDVIISQPSNPWISGISNLFTRDFFMLANERLSKGGIMAQWFQTYLMSLEDLKSVLRTFQQVFAHVSLWQPMPGDLIIIGSNEKHELDYARTRALLKKKKISANFETFKMNSVGNILNMLLMQGVDLHQFTQNALLNTDDRPRIEFNAPRNLYASSTRSNTQAMVVHLRESKFPAPISGLIELDGETLYAPYIRLRITNPGRLPLDAFQAGWLVERSIIKKSGTKSDFGVSNQGLISWNEAKAQFQVLAEKVAMESTLTSHESLMRVIMLGGITQEGYVDLPGGFRGECAVGPGPDPDRIAIGIIWQCPSESSEKKAMRYIAQQILVNPGTDKWGDALVGFAARLRCEQITAAMHDDLN